MATDDGWSWATKIPRQMVVIVVGVAVTTMITAYAYWLKRGCVAFLPFISDLGLRHPESTFFLVALALCGPLLGVIMIAEIYKLHVKLTEAGLSLAIWNTTVVCCALSCIGAAIVGACPWDQMFYTHCAGALFFFINACAVVFGFTLCTGQLHDKHTPDKSLAGYVRATRILLGLAFGSMLVGGTLYNYYGPLPPCPPEEAGDAIPPAGTCMKYGPDMFDAFCAGENSTHKFALGNLSAVCEWIAFLGILSSLSVYVYMQEEPKKEEAAPLLPAEDSGLLANLTASI